MEKISLEEYRAAAVAVLRVMDAGASRVNVYLCLMGCETALDDPRAWPSKLISLKNSVLGVVDQFHRDFPGGGPLRTVCRRIKEAVQNADASILRKIRRRRVRKIVLRALVAGYWGVVHDEDCFCEETIAALVLKYQ